MKRAFLLLSALALAGCSPASPRFLGQTPIPVEAGPHAFDVYLLPAEAQAVRTNATVLPDLAQVRAAAIVAMAAASGCRPDAPQLEGDVAILTAPLDCPAAD